MCIITTTLQNYIVFAKHTPSHSNYKQLVHVSTCISIYIHVHVCSFPNAFQVHMCIFTTTCIYMQLIFSRKSDCLGCAVLLCLVCLFDLACFFLSSFSSLI